MLRTIFFFKVIMGGLSIDRPNRIIFSFYRDSGIFLSLTVKNGGKCLNTALKNFDKKGYLRT